MLIQFKTQKKSSSILMIAPDGTIFSVDADPNETLTAERIGRYVLRILADPEQPETVVGPVGDMRASGEDNDPRGHYPDGASKTETHFRRALDSVVPGASKVLSFLQDLNSEE